MPVRLWATQWFVVECEWYHTFMWYSNFCNLFGGMRGFVVFTCHFNVMRSAATRESASLLLIFNRLRIAPFIYCGIRLNNAFLSTFFCYWNENYYKHLLLVECELLQLTSHSFNGLRHAFSGIRVSVIDSFFSRMHHDADDFSVIVKIRIVAISL